MKKWTAIKKDGTYIDEEMINWNNVKHDVVELSFNNNGQIIYLPKNMEEYVQGKTASAFMGTGNVQIESRYIGFKKDNVITIVRIDEKHNTITIESIKE